jgi:hypothetical protein
MEGESSIRICCFSLRGRFFSFEWSFRELGEQLTKDDYFQEGQACAVLNFKGISRSPQWWPRPDYDEEHSYVASLNVDQMVEEGYTEYSYDSGKTREEAHLVFVNHNDCNRTYQGRLETYLTDGAENAFVWYWQCSSWTGQNALKELQKRSIPDNTPEKEIINQLEAKSCTKVEAEALYRWLGKAVVILLPSK